MNRRNIRSQNSDVHLTSRLPNIDANHSANHNQFRQSKYAPIQTYLPHKFLEFSELPSDPLNDVNYLWLRFKASVALCNKFYSCKVKKKKTLKNNPWTTGEVMHAKHQLERIRKENKVTGTNPSNASRLALAKNFKEKSKAKHHYFNTVLTSFLKNNPYILEPLPPRKHSQLSFRPIKKKR